MSGRLPDTRRIRVVTARRRAVGERTQKESLETKVKKELRKRGWRPRCGECQSGDFAVRARVPCAKGNNGTPPDIGLCR